MTRRVRYSTPAPVTGGAMGGALSGFANFAQGRAEDQAEKEQRAYDEEVKARDYQANLINAMAQQNRGMESGSPPWMEGMEFEEAPTDYGDMIDAQKLIQMTDPYYQREEDQKDLLSQMARSAYDMEDMYGLMSQVGQGRPGQPLFSPDFMPFTKSNPPKPKVKGEKLVEGDPRSLKIAEFFYLQSGGDLEKTKDLAAKAGFSWEE